MPASSAICIGINTGDATANSADAATMADVAARLGFDNIATLTYADGATPGDQLAFSFSGASGADISTALMQVSDGVINNDEIRAILAGLPEGANLTMTIDTPGTIAAGNGDPLMLSEANFVGNVVTLAPTGEIPAAAAAAVTPEGVEWDTTGSPFTSAFRAAVFREESMTVSDVAAAIDAQLGATEQPVAVASANRAELLFQPMYGGGSGDAATDESATMGPGLHVVASDEDGDGVADRAALLAPDGTPYAYGEDADQDGRPEVVTHEVNSTTVVAQDLDADGVVERFVVTENLPTGVWTNVFEDRDADGVVDASVATRGDGTVDEGVFDGKLMSEALRTYDMPKVMDAMQSELDAANAGGAADFGDSGCC
ncbi:hypothetical protein H9P43_006609 [Blastocladiella emersonii ATCC 22665]|nr:hypothetical protein H9P43_006609 [Blastocladiella emersonii ATCC 22665]